MDGETANIKRGDKVYFDFLGIENGTVMTNPDLAGYVIVKSPTYGSHRRHIKDLTLRKSKEQLNMNKPAIITGVALSLIAIVGLVFAGNYNSLVSSKAEVDNAWAQVETQYQRRLDLIGNLVASVKGAQGQEQKVFGELADARSKYAGASSSSDRAEAASQTESALGRLLAITENYPELKSNGTVKDLMTQLTGTEDGIAKARTDYNITAKSYNVSIMSWPKNMFAGWWGYKQQALFKADSGAATAPKVSL
ncbi:LemA protein [Arthrobacter sp. B2I5]|uniref:LemA family protein n=1 Tax=Arthrobacter sp. B2I5 TaxID=3042266 RepID=UPI00277D2571|nr:LemA family protein [Arthrobacter sp. B2I5]MDQ0825381.1 LemA protein [Arthrobacter sp. B2I5]